MRPYAWMGWVLLGACWQSGVKGSGHSKVELRRATGFRAIEISGALTAEVALAAAPRVEVSGDDNLVTLVETEVHGDRLEVRCRENLRPVTPLVIRIAAPELTAVEASGASTITVHGVRGDRITFDVSGASRIEADGTVLELVADASGASTAALDRLVAERARVTAAGASTVVVDVTRALDAHASGASTVRYRGNPTDLMQDISGASTLEKR